VITSDREPSSLIDNYDNNNNIMTVETVCGTKVSFGQLSTSVSILFDFTVAFITYACSNSIIGIKSKFNSFCTYYL